MKVISLWIAPHLEDFLAAQAEVLVPLAALVQVVAVVILLAELAGIPAVLDVAKKLDAELVGVDPAA